ncbi:VapC ribonuclease [Microlunatus endophyticus]|uniref:Ribonuclease VapC n=1 Tax=Microlunatus endophyticus TaxID=1716077 RepID=A0A917W2W0_9ACTN|nr:type II toxin-antitoxin system VapC family toxin [Microlunatus endophyticus]GGL56779.1 VapC ribonuclease [Microlunatus endophyticus]
MIIIDASAMTEALVGQHRDDELLDALEGDIATPHILDLEVISALRGLNRGSKLEPASAQDALTHLLDLNIIRWNTEPLVERIWSLRHQFTSYDASYLALAEIVDAPLYTCDAKLDTDGHAATVRVFPRSI